MALGLTVQEVSNRLGAPYSAVHRWEKGENRPSAKYIAAIEKYGYKPSSQHKLASLKAILSTGSPLAHESFEYVYRDIKQDLLLGSISGGTDIVSCFCLSCPIRPVYRGELQCAGLGLAVDVVNESGQSVAGEKGELVCRKPFPAMPVEFFGDTGIKGEIPH